MKKFKTIERVRRPFLNYHKYLRLDRAEYGHKFGKENITVIGDNLKRIQSVILEISNRSKILITTGGLGPTKDDLTTTDFNFNERKG